MKVKGENRLITVLYPATSLAGLSEDIVWGHEEASSWLPSAACRPHCLEDHLASCHSSGSYGNLTVPSTAFPALVPCFLSMPTPIFFTQSPTKPISTQPQPKPYLRNKALCPPPYVSCSHSILRSGADLGPFILISSKLDF